MAQQVVVSDAGPLIALEQIAHLDLLRSLFGRVLVPRVVAREVAPTLPRLPDWIEVRALGFTSPPILAQGRLDPGEYEAILLASVVSADLVVVDDLEARLALKGLGFSIVGTVGVLLRAKAAGRRRAVGPLLRDLRRYNFFISTTLHREVLELAGETDDLFSL